MVSPSRRVRASRRLGAPRWLVLTLLVLVLSLGALSSLGVATARRPLPQVAGQIALGNLSGSVEVLRDDYGVPHLYADDAQDLFAAQGFVHAQDRFFEMDLRRHLTAGRLSELFGADQVQTDATIRTMGWRRVAERELELLAASTRRYLDAYASGVNAYLRQRSAAELSLEYQLLGLQGVNVEPQEWTAVDSLAWLKAMAWDLSSNRTQELGEALTATVVGEKRAAELWPTHPHADFAPIITEGALTNERFDPHPDRAKGAGRVGAAAVGSIADTERTAATPALRSLARAIDSVPPVLSAGRGSELGSNSWVVAGSRTTTGRPLLGNDPHLATSIPSVFAQVGLHCRALTADCPFDVTGFSFAGMPGVIIGKNQQIGWGLTTSYVDTQDLFLEQVLGDTVRVEEDYQPLEVRTELITVAGEETPRSITVRTSRHGPLLSDVISDLGTLAEQRSEPASRYAVAMSWTALRPGRSMDAIFAINCAASFEEFRGAVSLLSAPSQSLVYADTSGTIGYQLGGDVPRRRGGDGRGLTTGWEVDHGWDGLLPFDRLPYADNPEQGFIVASNQQIIGPSYPTRLGSDYSYGWRSQQTFDDLFATPKLSPDAAEQLFYDDTDRFAAELVPLLLKIKVDDSWVREGQNTLVGWDYRTGVDSPAAAYAAVVINAAMRATFADELPEELRPDGADRWYAALANLLDDPDNPWWDDVTTTMITERRDDILLTAMTQARKEITALMARDPDHWKWGTLHRARLRHQSLGSSGIGAVEALFNRGDFAVSGGPAVVNAMSFPLDDPYLVTSGPAMRMLVDLDELDRSRWVNQSGASGHAFGEHYDDQSALWADNRMWSFASSRAAVEGRTAHRLTLIPAG